MKGALRINPWRHGCAIGFIPMAHPWRMTAQTTPSFTIRPEIDHDRCPGGIRPMSTTPRQRLPNRRLSHTETLEVDGHAFTATVGFDDCGRPREVFMAAGKEGSLLNAMLADAAVAISVALQSGVPAAALAKSVGRLPADWRALWLVPGGGRPQRAVLVK